MTIEETIAHYEVLNAQAIARCEIKDAAAVAAYNLPVRKISGQDCGRTETPEFMVAAKEARIANLNADAIAEVLLALKKSN